VIALRSNELEDQLCQIQDLRHRRDMMDADAVKIMNVLGQYEKTISELIAENDRHRVWRDLERDRLRASQLQATEDLQMAESAFENVNRKFERLSTVIMDLKHNEDAMKVKVRESEERLVRSSAKYEALRCQVEQKLRAAEDEIDRVRAGGDGKVSQLRALLRRAELKASHLEETLEQKSGENAELCGIADELIAKCGGTRQ